jgi:hypothetical protein
MTYPFKIFIDPVCCNPCPPLDPCYPCPSDPKSCSSDPCADPCYVPGRRSDDLAYNGPALPCTEIETCDTLSVAIQKIEAAICNIKCGMIGTCIKL